MKPYGWQRTPSARKEARCYPKRVDTFPYVACFTVRDATLKSCCMLLDDHILRLREQPATYICIAFLQPNALTTAYG